jgi:hypothetical protein
MLATLGLKIRYYPAFSRERCGIGTEFGTEGAGQGGDPRGPAGRYFTAGADVVVLAESGAPPAFAPEAEAT